MPTSFNNNTNKTCFLLIEDYKQEADFISIFTMSAPSPTANQIDFCNALHLVNTTSEPQVVVGISDGTFNYTLSTIISGSEDEDSLDTLKMRPKYY